MRLGQKQLAKTLDRVAVAGIDSLVSLPVGGLFPLGAAVMPVSTRYLRSVGSCLVGAGLISLVFGGSVKAGMAQFMQACMNEGASYSYCQCAAGHIIDGATVYQAATLCNRGLPVQGAYGGGGGGEYRGNNVACMMMREQPMMLAAMGCY